jgi:cytochrome P450
LVINCNPTDEVLKTRPQTQELPKLTGKFLETNKGEHHVRNQLLQTQLRLAHLKEGEQKIRQICAEYVDDFKLPGDKLTATSAIEHYIPTPTLATNRAITLRNY